MISPICPLVGDEETTRNETKQVEMTLPCGSGRKYKKCCLAETFVQVGKEESIRKRPVDNLLEFHNTDTFQT